MANEKNQITPKTDLQTVYSKLQEPLDPGFVIKRADGMDYIAGYVAIEQANRIFGFHNWGYTITQQPIITKETDSTDKPYWYCTCTVKTWVKVPETQNQIEREDVGFGEVTFTKEFTDKKGVKHGSRPQIEVAYKGAVTDALKRALRGWGNQFGNSLYDREDKLSKIQETLSTAEEVGLSKYVQELLSCKTLEEVEKTLDKLVQIATQDNWNKAQLEYIKNMAEKVKSGLSKKAAREEKREGETKSA